MTTLRCFVSVEMSDELKARIGEQTLPLRQSAAKNVKWTPAENLHLTLKFLGDVDAEDIPRISGLLAEAARPVRPFEMSLFGAGVFPSPKSPRVVWIGVRDAEHLKGLAREVEDALEKAGFRREPRAYVPHLTLGRVRAGRGAADELIRGLATLRDVLFGNIVVKNICLMQSELRPEGARYRRLGEMPLGGE